ncbi:Fimbrial protein [Burkholderiales bacterium]|nr:Fimbrial protein [Burkholderiales bacterium]
MATAVARARQTGMSLIEMMVAIAIFTILALMALPMYSTWIASQQVRTATELVLDGLRIAQGEAIKRNQQVRLVIDPAEGWTVELVADDSVLRQAIFREGSPKVELTVTPVGTTTVMFDGLGRVLDKDAAALDERITIDVDSTSGFTGVRKLRVVIDTAAATGVGIRSCDPKLDATDPRGCPA